MSDKPNPLQDVTMNVAGLLFECRIAVAAVHAGVEMLARRSTEPPIAAELRIRDAKPSNCFRQPLSTG